MGLHDLAGYPDVNDADRLSRDPVMRQIVGGGAVDGQAASTSQMARFFRADAAFAIPGLYEMLEAEGYFYAIRLKGNAVLQQAVAHLLKRPVGRPPNYVRRLYHDFQYRACVLAQSTPSCCQGGMAPR